MAFEPFPFVLAIFVVLLVFFKEGARKFIEKKKSLRERNEKMNRGEVF